MTTQKWSSAEIFFLFPAKKMFPAKNGHPPKHGFPPKNIFPDHFRPEIKRRQR
jgi:hypothetical protein